MFIAASLASLTSVILLEAAKFLGGRAAADFLFKRIKKKLSKKKIHVETEGISEKGLEVFREVLQEELQSFGVKEKEVDLLIINGVQHLSDEHGVILKKMETIESLLVELTTGLLYDAQVGRSEMPMEMGEKLFERFIQGDQKTEEKIEEYIKEGYFSKVLEESMQRYSPIRDAYQYEEMLVKRFLRHFEEDKEQINQLALYAEIWGLIGSKDLEINKILEKIVFELLKKASISDELDLSSLLKFLHLLDTTGSLELLDYDTKSQIIVFLKAYLTSVPYYTKMELGYFLMKFSVNDSEIMDVISESLDELTSQNYSDKFVKESVSINKRILRYFKKKAKVKVEKSLRVIGSLVKRFERRKFSRSTALLEGQLTRTLAETNLLATQVEDGIDDAIIDYLRSTVIGLVESLVGASEKEEISNEHRYIIWSILDNCVFVLNRVAVENTRQILDNWEIDVAKRHGLYSKDWGKYRRQSSEEIEKTVRKIKLDKAFLKKVETEKKLTDIEDLPLPPTKEKQRLRGKKDAEK